MNNESFEWIHPVDQLEPEPPASTDQAIALKAFINAMMEWITGAQDCELAAWQVAYALESNVCIVAPAHKAAELGLTKQAMSKGMRDFIETHNLPVSRWGLSETRVDQYKQAATPTQ